MNTLIQNAKIPDFARKKWMTADLLISGGKIGSIKTAIDADIPKKKIVSAGGRPVLPAFADLRTHVFAPPHIRTENGEILRKTAAAGGYFTLLTAPFAPDPIVTAEQVRAVASLSDPRKVRILPTAAIADRDGRPADATALLDAGAFALADDGLADPVTLREAMRVCAARDRLFIFHACENARVPGISGLPEEGEAAFCEDLATARALVTARETGCRLHITGVSTSGALNQIRAAKAAGIAVTCDSAPPYFTMTKKELYFHGSLVKLSHPLRDRADQQAILGGIIDGTIDAISTDHTPVETAEKRRPMADAPCGMLALQTAFSVCMSRLVVPGYIDLFRLIELISVAPLRILGLDDRFEEGVFCPLVLCDMDRSYTLSESMLKSSPSVKNSPYLGQVLTGTVEKMIF